MLFMVGWVLLNTLHHPAPGIGLTEFIYLEQQIKSNTFDFWFWLIEIFFRILSILKAVHTGSSKSSIFFPIGTLLKPKEQKGMNAEGETSPRWFMICTGWLTTS